MLPFQGKKSIVLAMNNLLRRWVALCFWWPMLIALPANSASRTFDQYQIETAWFDSSNIYIAFHKTRVNVSSSRSDLEGTPKYLANERRIAKFDRKLFVNGARVNLSADSRVSTSIYKDDDFQVDADGDHVSIVWGNRTGRWPQAPSTIVAPVRYRDLLFFQNTLLNVTEQSEVSISQDFFAQINADCSAYRSTSFLAIPAAPVYAIDNERLYATCSTAWQEIKSLNLVSWSLGPIGTLSKKVISLPPSRSGYTVLNSSQVYSPARITLRARSGNELLSCSETECTRFFISNAYTYAILDDAGIAILLTQQDLTSPMLAIRVAKAH